MNVPSIASEPLVQWIAGMKFRASVEEVLKSVKNDSELGRLLARKRIMFEDKDNTLWIGIYGNQQNFWIGFGFTEKDGPARAFMLLQTALGGNRKDKFKIVKPPYGGKLKPEYADGKTWLNLEKNIDRELDGNGERIKEWLLNSAKWLVTLK